MNKFKKTKKKQGLINNMNKKKHKRNVSGIFKLKILFIFQLGILKTIC